MIKYIALALILAGCTTVPVTPKFPEAPQVLLEKCEPLEKAETASLSEFTKVVVSNYQKYHLCSIKHDSFVDWYNQVKK